MSSDSRSVNVTDGPLLKPIVVLSLPIVLTNLLQVGYNLADTFWVGRLGQPAVSALSFSWALVFLAISFSLGFSIAGTVLVAQNKGAGNMDRVSHVAGQTVTVVIAVSLVLGVAGYLLTPQLLQLVGAVPGTTEYALSVPYLEIALAGMPFVFGFFVFQSLLQGWGDTRTPLYLMAFGVGVNVIADPFFILGFQDNPLFAWVGLQSLEAALYAATGFDGFGVKGAAMASVSSRGLGAVVGIWLLVSGWVGIEVSASDFVPDAETVRRIFSIGVPASLEITMKALSVTILTALVAIAGAEAVASYGIGTRVTSMVVLPAIGLARGVETVVGQNLGAEQVDRAKRGVRLTIGIVVGTFLLFSVGVFTFAETIIGIFVSGAGEASVVAIGAEYLRTVSVTYGFLGVFYVVQGGFRGSGSTRLALVFAFTGFIVIRSVLAYVFTVPLELGATGIWYGEAASNVLMAALGLAYIRRGTWTDRVVDDEPAADSQPSDEAHTSEDPAPAMDGDQPVDTD